MTDKHSTKPSINWDHVSNEYNVLAVDGDGSGWLYSRVVEKHDDGFFIPNGGGTLTADTFTSYESGDCHWEDSVVIRPGYTEESQP